MAVQCPFCEVAVQVPVEVASSETTSQSPSSTQSTSPDVVQIETGKKRVSKPTEVNIALTPPPPAVPPEQEHRWKTKSVPPQPPQETRPPASSTNRSAKPAKSESKTRPNKQTPGTPEAVAEARPSYQAKEKQKASTSTNELAKSPQGPKPEKRKRFRKENAPPELPSEANQPAQAAGSVPAQSPETAPPPATTKPQVSSDASSTVSPAAAGGEVAEASPPSTERQTVAVDAVTVENAASKSLDETSAETTSRFVFRNHAVRFPPRMRENSGQSAVEVVVRSGIKEIEYHGEKVLVRDDQSLKGLYQIVGFVISLIILIVVLAWVTFKQ